LAQLKAKFATIEPLNESRTVTHGIAHLGRAHTSGELIENLLRVVIREGGELPGKRWLLCSRNAFWKAKKRWFAPR